MWDIKPCGCQRSGLLALWSSSHEAVRGKTPLFISSLQPGVWFWNQSSCPAQFSITNRKVLLLLSHRFQELVVVLIMSAFALRKKWLFGLQVLLLCSVSEAAWRLVCGSRASLSLQKAGLFTETSSSVKSEDQVRSDYQSSAVLWNVPLALRFGDGCDSPWKRQSWGWSTDVHDWKNVIWSLKITQFDWKRKARILQVKASKHPADLF